MNEFQKEFLKKIEDGYITVLNKRFYKDKLYIYLEVGTDSNNNLDKYVIRLDGVKEKIFKQYREYMVDRIDFYVRINSALDDNLKKLIIYKICKDSDNIKLSMLKTEMNDNIDLLNYFVEKELDEIYQDKFKTVVPDKDKEITISVNVNNEYTVDANPTVDFKPITTICNATFLIDDPYNKNIEPIKFKFTLENDTLFENLHDMYTLLDKISRDIKDQYTGSKNNSTIIPVQNFYYFKF